MRGGHAPAFLLAPVQMASAQSCSFSPSGQRFMQVLYVFSRCAAQSTVFGFWSSLSPTGICTRPWVSSFSFSKAALVVQQRAFRRSGLIRFGQDALWAAITFGWYGLFGQVFARSTPLFPSNFINQETFLDLFGFPIQMFRAV